MGFFVADFTETKLGGANVSISSVPIPAAAMPDDLLVMVVLGSWVQPPPPPNLPPPLVLVCNDPRMTPMADVWGEPVLNDGQTSVRAWGVWTGHTDTTDAIPFALQTTDGQFGQFASIMVYALRDDDGGGLEVADGRTAVDLRAPADDSEYFPTTMAAVPGAGAGAVAVVAHYRSNIGDANDFIDRSAPIPPWTLMSQGGDFNYLGHTLYGTELEEVPISTGVSLNSSVGVYAVVFGIEPMSAVTRIHPRDDGFGLSSATRLHPQPKSQRTVGEYP